MATVVILVGLGVLIFSNYGRNPIEDTNQQSIDEPATRNTDFSEELLPEDAIDPGQKSLDRSTTHNLQSNEIANQEPRTKSQQETDQIQYEVRYNILADGNSAQLSPTQAILSAGTVKLVVNLNCVSSCKFKLKSDTYNLTNDRTYTSSQKIEYILDNSGEWIFYNEYIPESKFKINF